MTPSRVEWVRSEEQADSTSYAHAAVANNASRVILTAGACPIDINGQTVCVGDLQGQAEKAMDNLEAALKAAGATLGDVLKLTGYVVTTNSRDLSTVWRVILRRFENQPPGTMVGVATLGYPDQLVEVEAIAAN